MNRLSIIDQLRAAGVECFTRNEWGSDAEARGAYARRRGTHPMPDGPADYHFLHLTVTRDSDTVREGKAGAQQIETYGYSTPPMVSYQDLVTNEGRYFEGQSYGVKGTHTVNDKGIDGFPRDLNRHGYACALMQNVGDEVTDVQVDVVAKVFAARELAGLVKRGAPIYPHRKFAWKSCPGDKAMARLDEIRRLKDRYVRDGLTGDNVPKNYRPFAKCDAVFWNMNNGARAGVAQALDALEASGARLICLNECGGHWPVLKRWAKANGFSIVTGEGDVGSASAILVRHHSGHIAGGVKTISIPWKGPQGKTIAGRALVFEKAEVDDRKILTIDMHQVWGPNRDSNDETKQAVAQTVRKWADDNPEWEIYAGADHNESRYARTPFSPLGTANYIDGRILPGGHSVDFIIYRPALELPPGARRPLPRVKVGSKYDSDHHALGVIY